MKPNRPLHLAWTCLASVALSAAPGLAASIIESISGERVGNPAVTKEYSKTIKNENGSDLVLKYRILRYGPVAQNVPVLVQVHEWGGDFARMVSISQYEWDDVPFVEIDFQFSSSETNTHNWWYGQTNKSDKKFHPYAHNAVVGIVKEVLNGTLLEDVTGSTPDKNRVYIFGHSIGGTGALHIGMRHPEIFAAISAHAGWTRFDDADRASGKRNAFRTAFEGMIGSIPEVNDLGYPSQETVMITENADRPDLPAGKDFKAYQYTNLAYYFDAVKDPGTPSPFVFFVNGTNDDPTHQGDNLQPVLEEQRRGYTYWRADGGHTAGSVYIRMSRLHKFRLNQSYLAFTNRDYGKNDFDGEGMFNDLGVRGWDPESIVDEEHRYIVKLSGKGTSDVTLRRLQKLAHAAGTKYTVKLNGQNAGEVVADAYGLVTIKDVKDDAEIHLVVSGITPVRPPVRILPRKDTHGGARTPSPAWLHAGRFFRTDGASHATTRLP